MTNMPKKIINETSRTSSMVLVDGDKVDMHFENQQAQCSCIRGYCTKFTERFCKPNIRITGTRCSPYRVYPLKHKKDYIEYE